MTSITIEACKPTGRQAPRRRALQELLRPRPGQLDVHPADRAHPGLDREALRPSPWSPRPTPAPSRPATTSARPPSCSSPSYEVRPAQLRAGEYTNVTGNTAAGLGPDRRRPARPGCRSSSAATRSPRPRTSSTSCPSTRTSACAPSRPRTRSPASAPPSAPPSVARSASPPPAGPGIDLKSETIGLAISLELPLRHHRHPARRPSTGLPTKTEQADLLHAMYGRHGEAPLPIVAARTPADCFEAAIEAVRLAVKYRTPVILLSDGYLANGAEPWRLPDVDDLPDISRAVRHEPNHTDADGEPSLLALPARPRDPGPPVGHPGHARPRAPHRRAGEGRRQRATSPTTRPTTSAWSACGRPRWPASPRTSRRSRWTTRWLGGADVLVLGWGSTYGAIAAGVPACGLRAARSPTPTSSPQPVPLEPGRGARAPTRRCWSRR